MGRLDHGKKGKEGVPLRHRGECPLPAVRRGGEKKGRKTRFSGPRRKEKHLSPMVEMGHLRQENPCEQADEEKGGKKGLLEKKKEKREGGEKRGQ